jgi:hypothetical protein
MPLVPHLSEHKITISVNGVSCFQVRYNKQLRYHSNGTYLKQEYLQKRHHWNQKFRVELDFEAAVHKQIQYMKFVHDIQPSTLKNALDSKSVTIQTQCPCCHTNLNADS